MTVWRGRNSLNSWLTRGKAATGETSLSSDFPGVRTPTGLTWAWRKGVSLVPHTWDAAGHRLRSSQSWSAGVTRLFPSSSLLALPGHTLPCGHLSLNPPSLPRSLLPFSLGLTLLPAQTHPQSPPQLPPTPPHGQGMTLLLRNLSPFPEWGLWIWFRASPPSTS